MNWLFHYLKLMVYENPSWWGANWCLLIFPESTKDLSHLVHLNGFSPVWILLCILTLPNAAKYFPHIGQLRGFSAVWILVCALNPDKVVKDIPQKQEKSFSPVWCLRCNHRESAEWNDLSHWVQAYGFSRCFSLFDREKILPHQAHLSRIPTFLETTKSGICF